MILIIDEEKRRLAPYISELESSGYEVHVAMDVDSAVKFLPGNLDRIELVILDIIMPPGTVFQDEDTRNGLRTGIPMYHRVRRDAPHMPVVVLTNVSDPDVEKFFENESRCWFLRKEDYFSFELAQMVDRILARS